MFENGKRYSCLKKGNRPDKDNYRPVSILLNLSKFFERCWCKQISTFVEDILSKYQCSTLMV